MATTKSEIRAEVLAAHEELQAIVHSLTADSLVGPTANAGWSMKDTLAHLSTIEERLRARVQKIVAGAPLTAQDVNEFNAEKVGERQNWTLAQLRTEIDFQRAETLALLDGLSEAVLNEPHDYPDRGVVTAADSFLIIPNHLRRHIAEMRG